MAEKLQKRQKRKRYKILEDIYEDIADLAGVRIALYFPVRLLLEFEDQLEQILKIKRELLVQGGLILILGAVAWKALAVRVYLEREATKIESLEEFLENIKRDLAAIPFRDNMKQGHPADDAWPPTCRCYNFDPYHILEASEMINLIRNGDEMAAFNIAGQ